mmetsp:Transcript_23113/g.40736  ORF Transcript_23113/g.40736 Transcript_23113/m.40736 type:complete len:201 (-) Transcript_23113:316-918(-)
MDHRHSSSFSSPSASSLASSGPPSPLESLEAATVAPLGGVQVLKLNFRWLSPRPGRPFGPPLPVDQMMPVQDIRSTTAQACGSSLFPHTPHSSPGPRHPAPPRYTAHSGRNGTMQQLPLPTQQTCPPHPPRRRHTRATARCPPLRRPAPLSPLPCPFWWLLHGLPLAPQPQTGQGLLGCLSQQCWLQFRLRPASTLRQVL